MKEMIRRVAMTLAVLMLTAIEVGAENSPIKYIERSWDNDQKKVVDTEKTITNYEILAGLETPHPHETSGFLFHPLRRDAGKLG